MVNFSIVIPIYNESRSIEKLVHEIFESLTKYQQYELILVNDGSIDETLETIKVSHLLFYLRQASAPASPVPFHLSAIILRVTFHKWYIDTDRGKL